MEDIFYKKESIFYRNITETDYPAIAEIYQQGIETKNATFETVVPDWPTWNLKYLSLIRFVATSDLKIVGWATLSNTSTRPAYSGVCEVSVYIHKHYWGKGIGKDLLNLLVEESEKNNIWTLQAGIFPENTASINMHINTGFRLVGNRIMIAKLGGVWRDTLLFERRSEKFWQFI